jgi:hypothetical protein
VKAGYHDRMSRCLSSTRAPVNLAGPDGVPTNRSASLPSACTKVPVTKVPVTKVPVTKVPLTKVPVTKVPVTKVIAAGVDGAHQQSLRRLSRAGV